MITHRPLAQADLAMLEKALIQDEYPHAKVNDYIRDHTFSEVYEIDARPVAVMRYTKTLRVIGVLCDNKDKRRNAVVIIKALTDAIDNAKANGFTDVTFVTDSPALAKFCIDRLGFVERNGEYTKYV
jgi:hypothetical protein